VADPKEGGLPRPQRLEKATKWPILTGFREMPVKPEKTL
jgi:hypothetical protein